MDRQSARWVAGAVAVVVLVLVAGCGDGGGDDEEADDRGAGAGADTEETEEAGESSGAADDPDLVAYCDAELAIETAPVPETEYQAATPEQEAESLRAYGSETMRPLADAVAAAAPAELAADVQVLSSAVDQLAASGDIAAVEQPEVKAARDRLHDFDLEHCGWRELQVTAHESAFEGVPPDLSVGPVSFELANEGEELHELVLARKNDGVTATVEELLALPEEEALSKLTFVDTALAAPGEADYLVASLEPGDYVGACFIPSGTTSEDEPPSQAMPHAGRGMVLEFSVA